MKCPQCNDEFELTLTRYFKAPFGRLKCPLCQTPLKGKHRWFYWALLVLSALASAGPLTHYWGALAGLAGGVIVVIPVDFILEGKFSVLEIRNSRDVQPDT